MSRRSREVRLQASELWPTLYQFLGGYCHEDWPEMHGSVWNAVDAAIAAYPLKLRQQVLKEWRDWNASAGAIDDIRPLVNDGFGVNFWFKQPIEARDFMNTVYDKLIVSVRSEVGKHWKP